MGEVPEIRNSATRARNSAWNSTTRRWRLFARLSIPTFSCRAGGDPRDEFVRDYGSDVHSDGKPSPKGLMIGYPTKALFIRNLVIYSSELASHMRTHQDEIRGGGFVGWGPFTLGGHYAQSNMQSETNFDTRVLQSS